MNNTALPEIKIASPCHADWGRMTGDERTRFCASCQKHVYNLSAMTAREGADLIRQKEGKLCVRYFVRNDGTILTQDCPVGLAAIRRQIFKIAAAFVGAFALLGFGCNKQESKPLTGETTIPGGGDPRHLMGDVAVPPQTNQAVEIKGAVVGPPQTHDVPLIMGEICPPAPTNAAPNAVLGSPEPPRQILGKVAAP